MKLRKARKRKVGTKSKEQLWGDTDRAVGFSSA
jgi:hypothetical protein